MFFRRTLASLALFAGVLGASSSAEAATRPYATLTDDGTLAKDFTKTSSIDVIAKKVLASYEAAGQKRPDILSVWTTFPMTGSEVVTLFLPVSNEVRGIGFDGELTPDGTFSTDGTAPLRAVLLHNDIRALDKRAVLNGTTDVDGMAEYLFLLELSHVWGPAIRVPAKSGLDAQALIGFDLHWSFWMDAGGSPAGGNVWHDNEDGTFTTAPQRPGALTYSMLDLYLMGLAAPEEVPPFGLLTGATVTTSSKDPMTQRAINAQTFPWFGETPVTVKATRVSYTIDDVIAASGERLPASASSPKSFTLGMALVVGKDTSDADRAASEAVMDRYAARFAPAFERATRGRGKLEVVSSVTVADADAGASATASDAPAPAVETPSAPAPAATGCATAAGEQTSSGALLLGLALAAGAWTGRRRRSA